MLRRELKPLNLLFLLAVKNLFSSSLNCFGFFCKWGQLGSVSTLWFLLQLVLSKHTKPTVHYSLLIISQKYCNKIWPTVVELNSKGIFLPVVVVGFRRLNVQIAWSEGLNSSVSFENWFSSVTCDTVHIIIVGVLEKGYSPKCATCTRSFSSSLHTSSQGIIFRVQNISLLFSRLPIWMFD